MNDVDKEIELEDLAGVGSSTAEKLRRAGINSVRELASMPVRELLEMSGLGACKAEETTKSARDLVLPKVVTARDFLERRKNMPKLTTGTRNVDALLDGGIEPGITELIGAYGTGKTQLCMQLCVTVQFTKNRGGLNGAAFYIDTEDTFKPERLLQIAKRLGLEDDQLLDHVYSFRAINTDHQFEGLREAVDYIHEKSVKLLIIDSLTSHFRSEYPGRENLVLRQQRLNSFVHKLQRLVSVYDLIVVVTNQVLDVPEVIPGVRPARPAGGNIVAHGSTFRLWLERAKGKTRITCIDSPKHARGTVYVKLTEGGVEDAEEED
ncbi:MAG: DNA repair and recombination protein RadA [Candidatus Methanomethylicaceae archaeon]